MRRRGMIRTNASKRKNLLLLRRILIEYPYLNDSCIKRLRVLRFRMLSFHKNWNSLSTKLNVFYLIYTILNITPPFSALAATFLHTRRLCSSLGLNQLLVACWHSTLVAWNWFVAEKLNFLDTSWIFVPENLHLFSARFRAQVWSCSSSDDCFVTQNVECQRKILYKSRDDVSGRSGHMEKACRTEIAVILVLSWTIFKKRSTKSSGKSHNDVSNCSAKLCISIFLDTISFDSKTANQLWYQHSIFKPFFSIFQITKPNDPTTAPFLHKRAILFFHHVRFCSNSRLLSSRLLATTHDH